MPSDHRTDEFGGSFEKRMVEVAAGSGYQEPFAELVKKESGVFTCVVGVIAGPMQAEAIITKGRADMVSMARAIIDNPHWPWRGAAKLWSGAKLARLQTRTV